jgi:hypothetical protein
MDALSQLGTLFSSSGGKGITDLLALGTAGAGGIGNILNNRERNQELNYVKQQQEALQDPAQLAARVKAATQPLDAGLVQSVGNQVSGQLAEQGLAQAPGIQGTVLAQALAPAELQEQQNALQLVLKQLGMPVEYAQTLLAGLPPNVNLAPLLAILQNKGAAGTGPGGQPNIAAILNLIKSAQGGPQQTSSVANPNSLQYPGNPTPNNDLIFAPDSSTWIPPAISDLPPVTSSFGG